MKKIAVFVMVFSLAIGANAQTKVRGGRIPVRTQVIVATPVYPFAYGYGFGSRFSPFYSSFNRPFYDPFYDPFVNRRAVETMPSELQLKLDEIENDYSFKIDTVKDQFSGKEKRQKMRELKYERDGALIDAKRSYLNEQNKKKKDDIAS